MFEVLQTTVSGTPSLLRSYGWYPRNFGEGPVAVVNCPCLFGVPTCSTTYLETAETNTQAVAADGLVSFGVEMGVSISFDGVSGSGSITVRRYNAPPTDPGGLPASDLAPYRIIVEADGFTTGPGMEVRFTVSRFGEIVDPDMIEMQSRPVPGRGPLAAQPTRYDAGIGTIVADVDGFSEFILLTDANPIPVELASFVGTATGEALTLGWTTTSETNNAGFGVERSLGGRSFAPIGHKAGFETTRNNTVSELDAAHPVPAHCTTTVRAPGESREPRRCPEAVQSIRRPPPTARLPGSDRNRARAPG